MSEEKADRFRDIHGLETVQYVLGLNDLPTLEEFIIEHSKTCKNKHRSARKCAINMYDFLTREGLL